VWKVAEMTRETDWEAAAKQVDWTQILLNLLSGQETGRDGQPCFFIGGGHFCGRAKFWDGHDDQHKFVPLIVLLARVRLDEANWWRLRSATADSVIRKEVEERLRTLEQAAGGSAARDQK